MRASLCRPVHGEIGGNGFHTIENGRMRQPRNISTWQGAWRLCAILAAVLTFIPTQDLLAGWGSPGISEAMDAAKVVNTADSALGDDKEMGKRFGRFMESFMQQMDRQGDDKKAASPSTNAPPAHAPPAYAPEERARDQRFHPRYREYDPWGATRWGSPYSGYDPWGAGMGYGALGPRRGPYGWGGHPPGSYNGGYPQPYRGYAPPQPPRTGGMNAPRDGAYGRPWDGSDPEQKEANPKRDYANPGFW